MKKSCALGFIINQKEAIPVRALPFITAWALQPSGIISLLSRVNNQQHNIIPYRVDKFSGKIVLVHMQELQRFFFFHRCKLESTVEERYDELKKLAAAMYIWFEDLVQHTRAINLDLHCNPYIENSIATLIHEGFEDLAKKQRVRSKDANEKITKMIKRAAVKI